VDQQCQLASKQFIRFQNIMFTSLVRDEGLDERLQGHCLWSYNGIEICILLLLLRRKHFMPPASLAGEGIVTTGW